MNLRTKILDKRSCSDELKGNLFLPTVNLCNGKIDIYISREVKYL